MNRMARHCRIRFDPHSFEASPDMLASDDALAMGRPDEEMNQDEWWSESVNGERSGVRREIRRHGQRTAEKSGPKCRK